jgi:hypothetical protein
MGGIPGVHGPPVKAWCPPEAGIDHCGGGLASFEAAPNLDGYAQYRVIRGPQF